MRTSWRRSRPAAACSPNSAPICPGRSTSPRCGGCATPRNAPPPSRCATAARQPVRRAVDWYRTHDRLHCGDADRHGRRRPGRPTDADIAAGKDALLLCDTTEMADALNQRIHDDTIAADAPTVTARPRAAHRRRRSDPQPPQRPHHRRPRTPRPARGSRPGAQRQPLARRRHRHRQPIASPPNASTTAPAPSSTPTTSASTSAYGYAVTVHSAQGVTADTTHAVLGETTTRALLYVAMTRGRDANTAYLYERATEQEYGLNQRSGPHVAAPRHRSARRPSRPRYHRQPRPAGHCTRGRCPNTQRRTASTRAPHPRPPRSDCPAPAGNPSKLARRRAELRPGDDHRTRAP